MDSYQEEEVEVVVAHHEDGWRLWVNIGGTNRLRIYRIKQLAVREINGDPQLVKLMTHRGVAQ
jgi:hypothetical protein